jgi:uncharacterized RDD family membrane protein YckC
MQIYIAKSGQQTGPFSVEQLQPMLDSGMITLNDSAWHDGLSTWQPLHQIISISPPISSPPPPFSISKSLPVVSQNTSGASPASFGIRLGAHIIDLIVTQIGGFIVGFMIGITLGGTTDSDTIQAIAMIAGIAISWLYYALMESSSSQATLGKMACGLFVTNLEGKRIGFGQASGRYFGMIVSALTIFIGFLMCAWTEKKQCLHDMMAGCLVLKK